MLRGDKALLGKVVNNLVSNAIHYSPDGSGLGLYIVKMILEQHGADYQIRNTEQGVCFMIHF